MNNRLQVSNRRWNIRNRTIDLYVIHDRYNIAAVIPAKAGIQTINEAPTKWDNTSNTALPASRRLFDKLDSRLRGNDDVAGFATIAPAPSVVFIYVKLNSAIGPKPSLKSRRH